MGELAVAYLDDKFAGLPDTLTVGQLAGLLGKDRRTVRRLLRTGVLPGYPLGDIWVIWRDDVKTALEEGRARVLEQSTAEILDEAEDDLEDLGEDQDSDDS